jgi:hypothetical protein
MKVHVLPRRKERRKKERELSKPKRPSSLKTQPLFSWVGVSLPFWQIPFSEEQIPFDGGAADKERSPEAQQEKCASQNQSPALGNFFGSCVSKYSLTVLGLFLKEKPEDNATQLYTTWRTNPVPLGTSP